MIDLKLKICRCKKYHNYHCHFNLDKNSYVICYNIANNPEKSTSFCTDYDDAEGFDLYTDTDDSNRKLILFREYPCCSAHCVFSLTPFKHVHLNIDKKDFIAYFFNEFTSIKKYGLNDDRFQVYIEESIISHRMFFSIKEVLITNF